MGIKRLPKSIAPNFPLQLGSGASHTPISSLHWFVTCSSPKTLATSKSAATRTWHRQLTIPTVISAISFSPFSTIEFDFFFFSETLLIMFIQRIARIPGLSRGLATHVNLASALPATLHLKTGQSFLGRSFGAPTSIFGETVFSTSITSCTLLSTI
jgi:hypothetical protein